MNLNGMGLFGWKTWFMGIALVGMAVAVGIRAAVLFRTEVEVRDKSRSEVRYSWGMAEDEKWVPSDPKTPSIYVTYSKPGPTAILLSGIGLPIPSSVESKLSWTYFDRDFDGKWDLRTAPGHLISQFEVLDADS